MIKYSQYSDTHMDEDWNMNIPNSWAKVALKRFCKITSGSTPKGQPEFWNGEIKWVTPDDLGKNNTKSIFATNRTITEEGYASCGTELVPKGSVVLSTRAPIGHTAIVEDEMCFNQGCKGLTPDEKVDSNFLYYLIIASKEKLQVLGNGTTFIELSRNAFASYKGIFPSLIEQTQIATFLDKKTGQIDRLIAQKEKLLLLLAEKRTAIITQAVTKGLDPSVEMKDSGIDWLGYVPLHWTVCQLKHKAQITYGVGGEIDTTLTYGIRLLSLPNVNKEGTLILDHIPFVDMNIEDAKDLLLQEGDLLFNWRNGSSDHLGKTAYFNLEGEYLHVSFLLRIRVDKVKNNPRFFQYLLHSLRLTGFFTSSKAGVNNTFNQNELKNLWVMIPPIEEQDAIAEYISSRIFKIDDARNKIEEGIAKLKEYRAALITAAVTGQIDVRKEPIHE